MIQKADSLQQVISRVDTLYIDRIDPLYSDTYIKLLEKSNEQLSLAGNPLAWIIGALGVLFAAGAIISGIHFWFLNNRFDDDKRKVLAEFDQLKIQYKNDLDDLVSAHKEQMNATNNLINTLSKAGKIQNEELMKLRGSIHRSTNAIKNVSRNVPGIFSTIISGKVNCSNCNKQYPFKFSTGGITLSSELENTYVSKCPHCGHLNKSKKQVS